MDALPRDEDGYRDLMDRFEARAIPREAWHHPQHVAVAFWYLVHLGEAAAIDRIRSGIRSLNDANGVPQTPTGGYHETWTIFFARILHRFIEKELDRGLPLVAQMERAIAHLADFRGITRRHYSEERITSWEARTTWVEPDLLPL